MCQPGKVELRDDGAFATMVRDSELCRFTRGLP